MKYANLILTVIFLVHGNCARQNYRIHIGESFHPSSQRMTNFGGSAIAAARADSMMELIGIYCDKNTFLDAYPVIRLYSREKGKLFVPLSARLGCNDGSLIKLKGRVVNLPITYSAIKKTLYYNHLEPQSHHMISDNQKIIDKVNGEYQKIRDDLQKKITIEQSKLQLSFHPEWNIWFDAQANILIFHSHQFDLMYAADIEFIVDSKTGKIKDVFAKEWFKGE